MSNWTFAPSDPPRDGVMLRWETGGTNGLFADPSSRDVDIAELVGNATRRRRVAAGALAVADAVDLFCHTPWRDFDPPAATWAAATRAGLRHIARGHLLPTVSAAGFDAWRVDPLSAEDLAELGRLAAALPVPAVVLAHSGRRTEVADPSWLIRCWWDAIADALVRTDAAPLAAGTHFFAERAPVRVNHLRHWADSAFEHLLNPLRLVLQIEPAPRGGNEQAVEPSADRSVQVTGFVRPAAHQPESPTEEGLVPLSLIWCNDSATIESLGPRAALAALAALRRAADVCPALAAFLHDDQPTAVRLSAGDLERLLAAADQLADTNIDLLVAGGNRTLGLAVRISSADDSLAKIDLDWIVTLDGEELTHAEREAVTATSSRLVWVRDQWVRVPDDVSAALGRRPSVDHAGTAVAAVLTGELPHGQRIVPVHVDPETLGLMSAIRDLGTPDDCDEPHGFCGTLRPYQRRGLAWLNTLARTGWGGVLADDMGLGKTLQIIALHLKLLESSATNPATLVVCPTSLLGNWQREIERFAPTVTVERFHGPSRTLCAEPGSIVLTTYGTLRRSVEELSAREWGLVVADEAQAAKNPRSSAARALRTIRAHTRLAVTGTPVENTLVDLWALLDWAFPGLLGGERWFRESVAVPIERDHSRWAERRLGQLTRPFVLRRTKADPTIVPDLPPKEERDVVVTMTPEQAALYDETVEEHLSEIRGTDGIGRRGRVLRLITALKQITNHPENYLRDGGPIEGRSAKLDALGRLVEATTARDERVIVFSQYVEMCRLIELSLLDSGARCAVLSGRDTPTARDDLVAAFQRGDIDVLIVSLRAGGSGLNLTAATHVVHFDRWWNPAVENQATDRAWRIGQNERVVVHRLISEGTIEEAIADIIADKAALAERVVAPGEGWIAQLDDDELARLVRLRVPTTRRNGSTR